MADSGITKRALAASLKELMREKPFQKIGIAEICAGCDMNRKSFYYHFKDKYALVNWIFDTETGLLFRSCGDRAEDRLAELCAYLWQNRDFYRKALRVEGQNSFASHFRDNCVRDLVVNISRSYSSAFCTDFLTDAAVCAVKRWLSEKEPVHHTDFFKKLCPLLCR